MKRIFIKRSREAIFKANRTMLRRILPVLLGFFVLKTGACTPKGIIPGNRPGGRPGNSSNDSDGIITVYTNQGFGSKEKNAEYVSQFQCYFQFSRIMKGWDVLNEENRWGRHYKRVVEADATKKIRIIYTIKETNQCEHALEHGYDKYAELKLLLNVSSVLTNRYNKF
ncbi:hypothetical protein L596_028724 [Steinernema carpocapsae]|uniref:Uncharacterized protein n=1 Tax=Steinernema carpocapsae TaxID=34508 RepID=A0A4U5LZ68_STECR|nr:hypothetical protein L596_028724 [Steinernema carpocapsae]